MFALAGFGVDYAAGVTNPLLTPPPPNGIGVGALFSEFQVLQIAPAVACRVTDRFSVAAGPTLNLAVLKVDPAIFAAPDNANGDPLFTYPHASHSETTWGAGFVVGAFYQGDGWGLGASVKSPQWFDTFRYNSTDEIGRARDLTFDLDLPMIVSVGGSFTGVPRWVFAADLRYLDYANADGLGDGGFGPDGAVRGVGWKSIFAVAVGAQFQVCDALSLRGGYTWNENPIPDDQSFVNTVSPLVVQHSVYAGVSWDVTRDFTLSLAYLHGFENSIAGPVLTPAGGVPGTSVLNTTSADAVVLGVSVKFGGPPP